MKFLNKIPLLIRSRSSTKKVPQNSVITNIVVLERLSDFQVFITWVILYDYLTTKYTTLWYVDKFYYYTGG